MNPISTNLTFQEQLKNSYSSNKNSNDLDYQQLNNKENCNFSNLIFNPQQTLSYKQSYSQKLKHYTSDNVDISPGIPSSKLDTNSNLIYNKFRNSCRQFDMFPVVPGYMGLGSNAGDIDVSSTVRNNIKKYGNISRY